MTLGSRICHSVFQRSSGKRAFEGKRGHFRASAHVDQGTGLDKVWKRPLVYYALFGPTGTLRRSWTVLKLGVLRRVFIAIPPLVLMLPRDVGLAGLLLPARKNRREFLDGYRRLMFEQASFWSFFLASEVREAVATILSTPLNAYMTCNGGAATLCRRSRIIIAIHRDKKFNGHRVALPTTQGAMLPSCSSESARRRTTIADRCTRSMPSLHCTKPTRGGFRSA